MEEEREKQKRKLMDLKRPELIKLLTIFSDEENEDIEGTKSEISDSLMENYTEEVSEFLENLKELSYARPSVARKYLKDAYPQKENEIENIRKKHQILLFLYENDIVDNLERVSFYCSFRGKELRNTYVLETENDLDYDQIAGKLSDFTSTWNEGKKLLISTKHYTTPDEKLVISILREHNQKTYSQFYFRENRNGNDDEPEDFKLKRIKIYPVWPERMEFNKIDNGKYQIVFDFDPLSESSILNCFVDSVFGSGSELKKVEDENVRRMQSEIKESIKKSPKLEEIDKLITKRKAPAIAKIRADTSLSPQKQTKIIDIVNSIQYAGPELKDDPKTTTKKLSMLVGNFKKLFTVIPSAENFIGEVFSKVSKSSENQNIYINNKSILITDKGRIKFSTRMSEDEKYALKIFLGEK